MEEFAIGMGPAIFSREYHGTWYSIRIFPIGGFCAMGEDDEATDSPGNFNNKSVWARMSVIAAGPVFNFILAFVFSVILVWMTGYDAPVVGSVDSGSPAAEAGIQEPFWMIAIVRFCKLCAARSCSRFSMDTKIPLL